MQNSTSKYWYPSMCSIWNNWKGYWRYNNNNLFSKSPCFRDVSIECIEQTSTQIFCLVNGRTWSGYLLNKRIERRELDISDWPPLTIMCSFLAEVIHVFLYFVFDTGFYWECRELWFFLFNLSRLLVWMAFLGYPFAWKRFNTVGCCI